MKVRDQNGWAIEVDEYQKVVDAIDNLAKGSADRSTKQYEMILMLMGKLLDANKANSDKVAKAVESSSKAMESIANSLQTIAEHEGGEDNSDALIMLVNEISSLKPLLNVQTVPPEYEFKINRDRNGFMQDVSVKPKMTLN